MSKRPDHTIDPSPKTVRATRAAAAAAPLKLGLIGDNIAQSRAPSLHRIAGSLADRAVTYDRLVPAELGLDLDEIFEMCAADGYRGVNVTYPYKERAAGRVRIDDPAVAAMGAVNTVLFEPSGPLGFNTDYSGAIAACRSVLGDRNAGRVCLVGAGGVGRAIAFGLLELGLDALRIVDRDRAKADALAACLGSLKTGLPITVSADVGGIGPRVDGLINCTPVGMVGYLGTPIPPAEMRSGQWAFDAVYTPPVTRFLADAAERGLAVVSGYELFFHQGVDAWRIFAGQAVDQKLLRRRLEDAEAGA